MSQNTSSTVKFWGHFFKLKNGEFQEIIALCRIQPDGHPRLQKYYTVCGRTDTPIVGTKDFKLRDYFAVIPVIDQKEFTYGSAEEFFSFVKGNIGKPGFISILCPDSDLLLRFLLM